MVDGDHLGFAVKRCTAISYLVLAAMLALGCAQHGPLRFAPTRAFDFHQDTFAFQNELYWTYDFSAGKMSTAPREHVEYGQRCITMLRATRQFFYGARFVADRPKLDDEAYRELVRQVLDTDPRREGASADPVLIPGYADLRSFSTAYEAIVKDELGGRWRSYLQRGNWRMVYPFAPRQQRSTASSLLEEVEQNRLAIVRLVKFPPVTVNHAVVVFAAESTPTEIRFEAYDPNDATAPTRLVYDRATTDFHFGGTEYFPGGSVNAYEIYRGPWF